MHPITAKDPNSEYQVRLMTHPDGRLMVEISRIDLDSGMPDDSVEAIHLPLRAWHELGKRAMERCGVQI